MITYEKARKIGVDACIDKLGREFVMKYKDRSSSAYGDRGDHAYCFVGVDNSIEDHENSQLILTSNNGFPFRASCNVRYKDGEIEFLECILP